MNALHASSSRSLKGTCNGAAELLMCDFLMLVDSNIYTCHVWLALYFSEIELFEV